MSGTAERRCIDLPEVPALGGIYAAAVKKTAASRIGGVLPGGGRRRGADDDGRWQLPAVEHRVRRLRVDTGRLTRYQRLMGDTVREDLPSVFVHGLAFPVAMSVMVDDGFPLPLLGMVHLSNRVEHLRRIRPGEELSVRAWAEDLRPHFAGAQVDVVAEVGAGGEAVWRGVSTYLAKGVDLPGRTRPERPEKPVFTAPTRTGQWRLAADTGRAYAGVLGDWNPIHLTSLSARALGMKRHIAHGMYLAGRALAGAAPREGGYEWGIEFASPVFLPGTVDFSVADAEGGADPYGTVAFTGWRRGASREHFSGYVAPR
ncbi:MaoC/PaaZ C-terminal domain-containing protein [Zhihengliuella salsuginis]|uniref:Acyl dehydratase n=1 Tax=Zhihengliuella salsuginis TaxID=578222 RepID=A0ABQ3GCK0_9MICC|nr:MaoC/PaaZ C-terminal domain-containing protein [Zhihengliuella salsuginis]GHD01699.1 acyl dehydratase [Zhihengliuella salsuginis]